MKIVPYDWNMNTNRVSISEYLKAKEAVNNTHFRNPHEEPSPEDIDHNLGGWMADYTVEELEMIHSDEKLHEAKDHRAMEENDNE